MKRFWTKFLVASVVCTSVASPVFATDTSTIPEVAITSEVEQSENTDAGISVTSDTEEANSDKEEVTSDNVKKSDSGFNIRVSGASNNGTLEMTFELQDEDGKSYGTATTNKSNIVNEYDNMLTFEVPKYSKGDVFKLVLKESPKSVTEVLLDDRPLKIGEALEIKVTEVPSEETGEPILFGHKDYTPYISVIAEEVNVVGIGIKEKGNFKDGVAISIKDLSTNVEEKFSSLDTYIPYNKSSNTDKLEVKILSKNYKIKGTDSNVKTITLESGKANYIDIEVEKVIGIVENDTSNKTSSALTVNVNTSANHDLSDYWSNLSLELTNGDMVTTLDTEGIGKSTFTLPNMSYKVKLVNSDYAKVDGVKDVSLESGDASLDLTIEPTHKLSVSKSVDGKKESYKFKVINVPEIAEKVYSGSEPINFAVMPGEAYMIQDVDSGEVLNVSVDANSPVTKVVLGEGVVTGFASVPETGDEGTALMWGLVLSLAGIFIVGGTIIVKKKANFKDVKKAFSLLLVATIIGGSFSTNVYAGSNMSGGDGSSGGSATSVPNGTGNLIAGVVRVYPAMLTDLGFDPAEGDYDANGTKAILEKDNKYWLHKYSIYFAPNTTIRNAWDRGAYVVGTTYAQAVGQHNDITKGGNYHKVISQGGSSMLYHDYYDNNHTQSYMTDKAKSNVTVDLTSHGYGEGNSFVNIMSKAMKDTNIRLENYGETLQKEFSTILKGGQGEKLWEDYKEIASKHGVYNNDKSSPDYSFAQLDEAFNQGKLGFFVESTIGWKVQGQSNKNIFMSLRTYLQLLQSTKTSMYSFDDVKYEKTTAQKSGVGGCSGGSACSRGSNCSFFHHLGWSHANIKNAYTVTLRPSTTPLRTSGSNPFGGWGYLHLTGNGNPENKPGVYVLIKDSMVEEPDGETYVARSRSGSTTLELSAYEEVNTINNRLEDLAGKDEIKEGIPLNGVEVINSLNRAVKGQLEFTEETQIRVFLDSDYQNKKVTDMNTETIGTPQYVGEDQNIDKDKPLTQVEKDATYTTTEPDAESIVLGGGSELGGTNWFGSDLNDYVNINKPTYSEDKVVDGQTIKNKGDLSDILIVITDAKIEIPDTVADENDKVVPEWRLSKHWNKLVPENEEVVALSGIGTPKNDTSSCKTGSGLSPSGSLMFNKKLVEDLPPYFFSKPIWGSGETGSGSITKSSPNEDIKVQGSILATKKNNEIDNIKVAKWVGGAVDLSDLGIGSTDKGATTDRGTVINKNHTFKYEIDNPLTYNNNYSVYYHDEVWCTNHSDSDDYHYKTVCKCELVDETLSDDTTGSKEPASYPTTVLFERYKPRDTVAPKVPYKEDKQNGKVTVKAQSPISLMVNPEVLMQYSDINGRNSVTFTAGDKLREVKPVSYHSIQYVAKVNPKVVGTSVATNNEAKALANRLNAGGSPVIYKGAGANISFDLDGKSANENAYVETKSYVLDIGNTAVKNSWNPNTTYSSQKVSDQFLGKVTSKDANGKLALNAKVVEQLNIDSKLYGKNTENIQLPQIDANTKEYRLVVRGGRLVSVDGDKNFKRNLPADVIKAFEEMTLLDDKGVLSVFDRGQGKKPESSFVTLGNAVRGTNDLSTNSGWYNEDTTVLVVREYSNKFEIPVSMFADKVPMTVPNLQTPINKMDFFTQGKTGHTVYTNSVISNTSTLNPYDNTSGNVEAVTMKHDSSRTDSQFGSRTVDYVVPNVSILDTMQ